jgi:hypothetical protein
MNAVDPIRVSATFRRVLGLAVACGGAMPALAQGSADPAATLFARDHILQIEIQMAPELWREVRLSHRKADDEILSQVAEDAYEYRRADVVIDGVKLAQVAVRKKGFLGSVVSTRPSLKIKFDEFVSGQSYAGVDGLTLNNNNQDQTLMQTFLAYDFFARAGVAAPRANFAHLRVNGEDLGIYTHVEAINKSLVRRAFGSDHGVLYESYAGDFTKAGATRFVEKSGAKNQDRGAVAALTDLLAAPGPVSVPRIAELVELDSFIRMWAAESLIAHWDSYTGNRNNYYLYADPATRKLRFIPWGPDSVFVDPGPLQVGPAPKSFKAVGLLARRLWELPEISERYRRVMRELLAGPWDESRFISDFATMQRSLVPQSTLRPGTVRAATAAAEAFIKARRGVVEAELPAPGPDWPSPVAGTAATPPNLTITGSFTAPWGAAVPANPLASGRGSFELQVAGKPQVNFSQVGAYALTLDESGPRPATIRTRYQQVALTAQAGDQIWQLLLTIDPFLVASGARVLPVDHYAVWAILVAKDGAAAPRTRLWGNVGELRLDEAATREGGTLRGSFTLRGLAF